MENLDIFSNKYIKNNSIKNNFEFNWCFINLFVLKMIHFIQKYF